MRLQLGQKKIRRHQMLLGDGATGACEVTQKQWKSKVVAITLMLKVVLPPVSVIVGIWICIALQWVMSSLYSLGCQWLAQTASQNVLFFSKYCLCDVLGVWLVDNIVC